jgi:phosphate-selective porin OprO/OprP
VDSRWFINDGGNATADTFLIRRARPIIEGTFYKKFEFRIMPDFAPASVTLEEAYSNYKARPEFQVQIGKFKAPVGLERLQSATAISFAERGFPTGLVPNRDLGVQIHGSVANSTLDYAVGLFNGTADGGSLVTDTDSGKDVAVRLFTHPLWNKTNSWARGFGVGAAATYGNHKGAPRPYVTPGQQSFFTWAAGVENDGGVWRFSPQAYYYKGPFGILGEYVISSQEVKLGVQNETIRNEAWQLLATWVITGEDASYRGVTPRHPFDLSSGHFGALELAARYGELHIDDNAFPVYANPNGRASRARTAGVGLNWYLNANVKLATDYAYTTFSGGDDGPISGQPEHIVFNRVQVSF